MITMSRLQPFFSTIEFTMGSLHLAEIQDIFKKELKNKSGIYGFICKTNNKLYIGSSIILSDRLREHKKGLRSNVILQNAIKKYGLKDFIFIVFEYCDSKDLLLREQFYFDALLPEFNILKVAGSSLGYKHSEDTKALMSLAQKGISRNKGIPKSLETKALISEALKGKNHSLETKTKMSIAKGTAIYVYDSQGSLAYIFSSARKAAEHFGCSYPTILKFAKNGELFQEEWLLSTS